MTDWKLLDEILDGEAPILTVDQAKALSKFWDDSGQKVRAALVALQIPTFDMQANARANESYRRNLGKIARDLRTVAVVLRAIPAVLEKMADRIDAGTPANNLFAR